MAIRSLAQSPNATHSVEASAPIEFSPIILLSVLPLPLTPDDSLRQRAFRRNRVKTVTLVQLRGNSPADTIDYSEVDRQGHVQLYRPALGQSYRQRYDRQDKLVERTTYPSKYSPAFMHVQYDPASKATTSSIGPTLKQLDTWQTARIVQIGDTLVTESFFLPTPLLPTSPVRRLVLRSFRTSPDTTRNDLATYDASEQLIGFEAHYRLGSRQHPRELGDVSFVSSESAQVPPTTRRLLRASQQAHGHYLPTTRYTYDKQGSLVRQVNIPRPQLPKPKMTLSNDERMLLTIAPVSDTLSVRYVRRPDGQLLREECRINDVTAQLTGETPPTGLSFTDYTYLPTGLRHTKTGSLAARYEYRYTYY
jgi:YD repeat-containing protein